MYSEITSNKRKTALLIAIFVAFVLAVGWFIGEIYGQGTAYIGLIYAAVVSLAMTLISYFGGDKIALWSSRAQILAKNENPYVYRIVENLCITNGIPTPKIYIMTDMAINAFATGRNPKNASIAVTSGAIEKLKNEELEGVLAHELSHIKNYDIRLMTVVIVLVGTISILTNGMLRAHFFGGRRSDDRGRDGSPILLVIGIILIILSPIIAKLIQLAVSRKREYLADASGALLTRYPEGLASALEKIAGENAALTNVNAATAHLFFANPFGVKGKKILTSFFSTHPPIEDRIRLLRQMGK